MKLPKGVTRAAAKSVLKAKKNSPHLFFGAGLGGVGLATVLACKQTLKLEATLDQASTRIQDAKLRGPYASQSEENRAVAGAYVRGGVDLAKLYAPPAIIGGLGVAALTGSHVQLTRRNTALAGSLAATIQAFNEYRGRVADKIGVDPEKDLYRGVEDKKITNEDGSKEIVKVRTGRNLSPYARCFDEQSKHWMRNAEMNRNFVMIQQEIANHDLKAKGHVFLNDVYKALGFEETAAGQQVGWILNGNGDGYIDFGLHEVLNTDFVDGHERSAWLDFNVDGVILEGLEEI